MSEFSPNVNENSAVCHYLENKSEKRRFEHNVGPDAVSIQYICTPYIYCTMKIEVDLFRTDLLVTHICIHIYFRICTTRVISTSRVSFISRLVFSSLCFNSNSN